MKKNKNNKLMYGLLGAFVIAILGGSLVAAYQGNPDIFGPNHNLERQGAMEEAFGNLDYTAWYNLMTQDERHPKIVDIVTEDNYGDFVKMRSAMHNGDVESAKQFRENLGIGEMNRGYRKGQGMRRGLSQGQGNCQMLG